MSPRTIAAIEAAVAERRTAKGERKSALTREIVRLATDDSIPKGSNTVDKPARPKVWEMSKDARMARYVAQKAFFNGPASKSQRERCNEAGANLPKNARAFQAAEAYAEKMALDNGIKFARIIAI
jgi:hypothetical protein